MAVTDDGTALRVVEPDLPPGSAVTLALRPERITFAAPESRTSDRQWLAAQVQHVSYLGAERKYQVRAGGLLLNIRQPAAAVRSTILTGDSVTIGWRPEDIRVLPATDEAEET
jgi:ABC-type Fe3+/spermidine/putrescine transport system ATPase subunit